MADVELVSQQKTAPKLKTLSELSLFSVLFGVHGFYGVGEATKDSSETGNTKLTICIPCAFVVSMVDIESANQQNATVKISECISYVALMQFVFFSYCKQNWINVCNELFIRFFLTLLLSMSILKLYSLMQMACVILCTASGHKLHLNVA